MPNYDKKTVFFHIDCLRNGGIQKKLDIIAETRYYNFLDFTDKTKQ